ncbi:hypothetical protein O6H91_20G012900 [Diphasiastrum complanatum]|uniref:Uncharacterized protein n=1 Tax=Diphasiastrum complanatum TaxID=34168 RepID=A0ACC2AN07_DIPCM|nr:hypothetical protein O6H91_20G012900 [Diphasiastrum complanatum]
MPGFCEDYHHAGHALGLASVILRQFLDRLQQMLLPCASENPQVQAGQCEPLLLNYFETISLGIRRGFRFTTCFADFIITTVNRKTLACRITSNELESVFLPEISFNRVAFEYSLDPPLVSISSSSDFADFFRKTSSLLFSMLSLAQDIFELILLYVCFQFETV